VEWRRSSVLDVDPPDFVEDDFVPGVTNLSSKHSSRTAPLTYPSSNLAEANNAAICSGDLRGFNRRVKESSGAGFWDIDEGSS